MTLPKTQEDQKAWEVECAIAGYYHVVDSPPKTRDYFESSLGDFIVHGPSTALCGYDVIDYVVLTYAWGNEYGSRDRIILPLVYHQPSTPCPRCTQTRPDDTIWVRPPPTPSKVIRSARKFWVVLPAGRPQRGGG